MPNVVGDRFQVTIDRRLREQLGIRPGDVALERVEGRRLVIEFMPAPHDRSLRGIFRRPGTRPVADWRAAREQAWAVRSGEVMDGLAADSERHRGAR